MIYDGISNKTHNFSHPTPRGMAARMAQATLSNSGAEVSKLRVQGPLLCHNPVFGGS